MLRRKNNHFFHTSFRDALRNLRIKTPLKPGAFCLCPGVQLGSDLLSTETTMPPFARRTGCIPPPLFISGSQLPSPLEKELSESCQSPKSDVLLTKLRRKHFPLVPMHLHYLFIQFYSDLISCLCLLYIHILILKFLLYSSLESLKLPLITYDRGG